ncbi:MAG: serine hydrolase domain-containing protein [Gemmatimonadaceae bacterium]
MTHGLLLLLSLQVPPDSLQRVHVRDAVGARLDAQLTRYADSGFAGTVLVVRDRRVLILKGYGLSDPKRTVRNSPATRYEQNSMTKMFTGVSILQLAASGRLGLHDPIERVLGGFPDAKRGATIAQLAAHTSGLIVDGTALAGESREAFVRDVKRTPAESAPGARYRYTNAGFSLLAAIIEAASGQRFEDYLRQRVFEPAGMRTIVFRDEVPEADSLFARPFTGTANPYVWGTRGAGGVWSTVGDMYRWVVAVEDGLAVAPAQRAILFAPPEPPAEEAYGWHVRPATDSTRLQIDKGGGSASFQSQLVYYPNDRVVIVWATNDLRQRWRQTMNRTLADIVFGGPTR